MSPSPRRTMATRTLLGVAQLGQAQWFFGNLYEAVARIPDRLAHHRDLAVPDPRPVTVRTMLRPGSPARYYLPVGPTTVAAAVGALGAGWTAPPARRRWLATTTAATLAAALTTGYIVHEINVKLFFVAASPSARERDALLRRWYALNTIRLVATGIAWIAARQAKPGHP